MSDLFMRLGRRALAATVGTPSPTPLDFTLVEADASRVPVAAAVPLRVVQPRPEVALSEELVSEPVINPAIDPVESRDAVDQDAVLKSSPARSTDEQSQATAIVGHDRSPAESAPPSQVLEPRAGEPVVVVQNETVVESAEVVAAVPGPLVDSSVPASQLVPVLAAPVAPAMERQQVATRHREQPDTVVKIHIGRLDVRATPVRPAKAPKAERTPVREPLDLGDYLRGAR